MQTNQKSDDWSIGTQLKEGRNLQPLSRGAYERHNGAENIDNRP